VTSVVSWRRATGLFLAVAISYGAGAALSWQTFGADLGPAFFPPAGVTVAAMLLTRRSLWPLIVAAITVAEVAIDVAYGSSGVSAAGFALANSVEPVAGAWVVGALCGGVPDLRLRGDLIRFVMGGCVVGPFIGALIGVSVSAVGGQVWWPWGLVHWWAGDGVGVLVVGAPILLWHRQKHVLRSRRSETVSVLTLTAGLAVTAFWFNIPPYLLLLPVLAWAAFRLDMIGAALAGAVVAFVANYMTVAGRGSLAGLPMSPVVRLSVTQAYIAVLVLVAMLIAQEAAGRVAAITQRQSEQRERARLETLARLAQLLGAALTPEHIGDVVAGQVLSDAGAQGLALGLVDGHQRQLEWICVAGHSAEVTQFSGGVLLTEATAACQAVRTGTPIVIRSPVDHLAGYQQNPQSTTHSGAAAAVDWPLKSASTSIGVLHLMWTPPQPLDSAQLAYVSAVATMIAQALVRARIYADEHAKATVLQAAVLPTTNPKIPGLDIAVSYEPADVARGLGGDWYDVMPLPQNRTFLTVGDVVGHGLPAVEDMAQLRGAARAMAVQGLPPARLLAELNTFTRYVTSGKFATMTVAIFDPPTSSLTYASAGHPPALLRRSDDARVTELIAGHGPALGPVHDPTYTDEMLTIEPGDILIMYTDGLIERPGQDLDTGIASISEAISSSWHRDTSLHQECRKLIATFAPAPRDDDVCVMAVRFSPET
jgi:serine phosphatase RsbU (regulator of sigma subunit)/integral membrane sensor domain MASE1